ncbi:zinc-dependent metalloprotease [Cellulomonas sp. P22]|uniref:zinc-dependent metalloprotease n=1 Tax=Cellulomonas sp. P22 TaxID=3373189 RepID=UPI0037914B5A
MSSERPADSFPEGEGLPEWEQLLRQMFGPDSEEALRQLRAQGMDPAALASASGLPDDPQLLGQVLAQVQRLLAASGEGPVNWDLAHDVARQAAVAEGDPSLTENQVRQATGALSVAELWLDAATDLPPAGGPARALNRSEWVELTLPAWRRLTEPIASSLSTALADALAGSFPDELPPDMPAAVGPLGGTEGPSLIIRQLGSAVFGMQVGQAAGTLSREVFGLTDIGVPLVGDPTTALVPTNVDGFAEGLDAPVDEVRLFLALREAAHARLFTHVPWLRAHLLGAVEAYARGITIDVESLDEAVRSIDPTDPSALQAAISRGVFEPQTTREQQVALARLETALALVEGWVDEVTTTAALPHLPHAVALREMIRRRRAAGGPAEQTFATLVGLELRPRRSRDAAALWARIAADGGREARDAVWDHPDLMPTTEDLDDPQGYTARRAEHSDAQADVDRAIAEIFGEASSTQDGAGEPDATAEGDRGASDDEGPAGPAPA